MVCDIFIFDSLYELPSLTTAIYFPVSLEACRMFPLPPAF